MNIGNTDFSVLGGVCDTILPTIVFVEPPLAVGVSVVETQGAVGVTFPSFKEFVKLPLSVDAARVGAPIAGSVTFLLVEEFVKLPLSVDASDGESFASGISML